MRTPTDKLRVDLQRRRITLAESDGKAADEWRIDQVRQKSKAFGRSWGVIFHDAARAISRVKLSPSQSQVLWWCMAELHPHDPTLVLHEQIAEGTGLTRSAVTKALAHLRERGLIVDEGRSLLRLSPAWTWQGTAQAYQKQKRLSAVEFDQFREWHKRNAAEGATISVTWRFAGKGSEQAAPRQGRSKPDARRGGDAKGIGDLIPRFDKAGGHDE